MSFSSISGLDHLRASPSLQEALESGDADTIRTALAQDLATRALEESVQALQQTARPITADTAPAA